MQLTGSTWDHPRGLECVRAASAAYRDLCGVSIDWQPRSLQAFADAPIADLAARYDLIVLDHPHIGQVAQNGALMPLPEDAMPKAIGGASESYHWQGRQWAYAIDAACQMAAFRPDLLPVCPATWEAVLTAQDPAARPLTPLLPVDAFDTFLSIVAGRGEETMPHDPQRFVSDRNGHYALEVLRGLYALGPEAQVEMNPIAVLEVLSGSDEFTYAPSLFGYVNYARPGFRDHPVAYADLPLATGQTRPRAILGGAGIGVSATTQAPQAALEFARWLSSEPVQSGVYLANQGQPAHLGTWDRLRQDRQVAGFFGGGYNSMSQAWTRPRDPWFLGFVDQVCEILPDFFRKREAIPRFLDRLNALYRQHAVAA